MNEEMETIERRSEETKWFDLDTIKSNTKETLKEMAAELQRVASLIIAESDAPIREFHVGWVSGLDREHNPEGKAGCWRVVMIRNANEPPYVI